MRSVTIIGAGPAGLTAARVLRSGGVDDVLVLERNEEAGGLPRFCGHLGWGLLDFHRLLSGPTYARRLVEAAEGIDIRTNHTVIAIPHVHCSCQATACARACTSMLTKSSAESVFSSMPQLFTHS